MTVIVSVKSMTAWSHGGRQRRLHGERPDLRARQQDHQHLRRTAGRGDVDGLGRHRQ